MAAVPTAITEQSVELSTPTGLAILKALSPTFLDGWPAGTVLAQGMGCGTRKLGSYPNVFRVALFDTTKDSVLATLTDFVSDRVVEICFNIDDETGERVAWIVERLQTSGALDVWCTNIVGKKGRLAVQVSLLANPREWPDLADWILRHTSTFGVRHRLWERSKLKRSYEVRQLDGRKVKFKIGRTTTGEKIKEKPIVTPVRMAKDCAAFIYRYMNEKELNNRNMAINEIVRFAEGQYNLRALKGNEIAMQMKLWGFTMGEIQEFLK